MTHVRWRYVWRSLWIYRSRTLLIVLSTAVGIFTFGMIIGAAYMLLDELPVRYQEVHPASVVLHTGWVDQGMVDSVRRTPGVAVAEGRTRIVIQYQRDTGEWHDLELIALEDYAASQVSIVRPVSGPWPPPERQALVERNSLPLTGYQLGESLLVENSLGDQRRLPLVGVTHDMNEAPAQITGVPYVYVAQATLEWLGLPTRYNEIPLLVDGDRFDLTHINQVAQAVTDKLEHSGVSVTWTEVPKPGEHWFEEFLPTIVFIQMSLGLLAVILSGFLVINVITALLSQQTRQIGVMKAIGGRPAQIAEIYLRMVICFGAAALVLAIPLGLLGARVLSVFLAGQMNFDLVRLAPDALVIGLQVLVGILAPVVSALFPVLATIRKPAREALQDSGLDGAAAPPEGPLRHMVALQQRLPMSRPMRLSLRNTFRRRGRLVRTLIPLALGGALFMSVLSVRASLFRTLEQTLVERGYDVQVQFTQAYPLRRIEHVVAQLDGVAAYEGWTVYRGVPVAADQSQGDSLYVYGLPPATRVYQPTLVQGRWLRPDDTNALVATTGLISGDRSFELGRTVTLRINGEDDAWRVVGVVEVMQPPIAPAILYANQSYLWQEEGGHGRADLVRILMTSHDSARQRELAQVAEDRLQRAGLEVQSTRNASEDRVIFTERFNIVTVILMIMAFLLAMVGSLGLMGTMSINVLERRREIGVLRAIGASDHAVIRLFVVESVIISILSWAVALLLAQVMSRVMSYAIGMNFLKTPLRFIFDWSSPVSWLGIIVVVAALASMIPARGAAHLSVRETLSYEG